MERTLGSLKDFFLFVAAVAVVLIALIAASVAVGICADAVHLGYEWTIS